MGSHTKNRPQAESITEEQIQAFIEKLRRKKAAAPALWKPTAAQWLLYMPPCRKRELDASTWDFWKTEKSQQSVCLLSIHSKFVLPPHFCS